jgi:diguanylate cyclase (GGDEF)-like protein/PAS domain S-box-containing protein
MIVGVLAAGKIVKKPIVQFLTPVIRNNKVRFVLAVVMNPTPLSSVFADQRLATSWTGAIVDNRMTLAGRSRDPERFVGKQATPTLADRIAASESGMFTALNQEGATVYTVFSRSPSTGWSVAIGIPATEVEGPIRRILFQLSAAGGVLITFALILTGLVGRGIVKRRNAYEQALHESEQRYHIMFDNNPMPMWVYAEGSLKFLVVNDRAVEHYGFSREEFSHMTLIDIRPEEDIPEFYRALPASPEKKTPSEWRHKKKDSTIINVAISVARMMYDGVPARIVLIQDITARKQAEEKLQLAASVFSHAREGIMITAADGHILDVNDAFSLITGYSRDEALGRNPRFLSSGRQKQEYYAAMWRDLVEKGHWYGEIWNRRKSGEVYAVMQTISTVRDTEGKPLQYVALFSDITAIKEHQQQLEHIAHYDALTGLPNRVLFADRLHQAMVQTQRRKQRLAVVYLDLDGFKAVNDTHGHETGDQLLMALATRMKQALREGDTLARLGGDEFVAVLLDLENAAAGEPMLIRLLAAAAQPVQIGNIELHVTASIGVTFFPQAEDIDADQLLRQADQAMYQAKLAGKNRYQVFGIGQDSHIG